MIGNSDKDLLDEQAERISALEAENARRQEASVDKARAWDAVAVKNAEIKRLQDALMLAQAWMLPVQPEVPGQEALRAAHATVREALGLASLEQGGSKDGD